MTSRQISPPAPEPFVVLASARTGSTHLVELMNLHPNVVANGELLNPREPGWPDLDRGAMTNAELLHLGYEDYPRRGHKAEVTRVGCKIIDNQAEGDRAPVLDELASWSGLRVILLRRLNVFEAIRSRAQAKQTGEWDRRTGSAPQPAPPRVRLRREECDVYLRTAEAFDRQVHALFSQQRVLELSYEELLHAPEECLRSVWQFLEVDEFSPRDDVLQRMEARPLRETVLNYEELKGWFADTPYERYLT